MVTVPVCAQQLHTRFRLNLSPCGGSARLRTAGTSGCFGRWHPHTEEHAPPPLISRDLENEGGVRDLKQADCSRPCALGANFFCQEARDPVGGKWPDRARRCRQYMGGVTDGTVNEYTHLSLSHLVVGTANPKAPELMRGPKPQMLHAF